MTVQALPLRVPGQAHLAHQAFDGAGSWRGIDDVEFATMTYVDWFNHRRLHGTITDGPGFTTPAAHEAAHYRQTNSALEPITQ